MSKKATILDNLKNSNPKYEKEIRILKNSLELKDWDEITEGRYSSLFLIKLLWIFLTTGGVNRVINEIKALEGVSGFLSKTKPPTEFNRGAIKGLWHKHYSVVGLDSLLKNWQSQLNYKKESLYAASIEILQSDDSNLKKSKNLSKSLISDLIDERIGEQRYTGEWIIYHVHEGKNYYLDISNHDCNKEEMIESLREFALQEFPEFKNSISIFKEQTP